MKITTYTSAPEAFFVNSHIIELEHSLVVVDTQFILPEGRKLAEHARQIGKPLAAILLTHPHPDHVNGTAELLAVWPNVPVVATDKTTTAIAELAGPKREQWKPSLGDAYPDEVVMPTHVVRDNESFQVEDARFLFKDLGALESINESIIEITGQPVLIAGDFFYNQVHPWLIEGRSVSWLNQLKAMIDYLGSFNEIYVGHGFTASALSAQQQVEYMEFFFFQVQEALSEATPPSPQTRATVLQATKEKYAGWGLEMLVEMNFDAMVRELSA